MTREFRSLSGEPMEMSDSDRILCIISDERWRQTSKLDGTKVVGPETALMIREALRAEGFEILRHSR
jgi:hypothetical protein